MTVRGREGAGAPWQSVCEMQLRCWIQGLTLTVGAVRPWIRLLMEPNGETLYLLTPTVYTCWRGQKSKIFKRPKNREDNCDFEDFLPKSTASTRTKFWKNMISSARAAPVHVIKIPRNKTNNIREQGVSEELEVKFPFFRKRCSNWPYLYQVQRRVPC